MDDSKIVGYKNEIPPSSKNLESSKQEVNPICVLHSSIKKLQMSDFSPQKLFLQQMAGLKRRIPKQIMSLEEKYLRHCLELIHISAMRSNSFSNQSKVTFLPDRFSSRMVKGSNCDTLFLFSSEDEKVVISSSMDPIVGSITESKSMMNLLNSPLLLPLDSSNENTKVKESLTFGYESIHQRFVSISSTNSTFSDPSSSTSSSSSNSYSQGMLHCSWNSGFPRYIFSIEDQREVYTTNLSKIESIKDEGLDYVYMFHDNDSELVAKMKVSTSFTFCSRGTEIMETQFTLCSTGQNIDDFTPVPPSNQIFKKSKGLSKKVSNIFKGNPNRSKTHSKFDGTIPIPIPMLDEEGNGNVTPESSFPTNLESVAIVVKDRVVKKVEVGGWGLKFLKEGGDRKVHLEGCEVCGEDSSQHCSSMDVIVPKGIHGGPKVKNGGPSSLVERWRNGGCCDCGGWDIGCPITVLNGGTNNKDGVYQGGVFGKSNSFELFTEGCKQSMPVIEVTNIHDGLYYIHYQSNLSSLQSLAIAVAIIHSHSPTLKPKVYRN